LHPSGNLTEQSRVLAISTSLRVSLRARQLPGGVTTVGGPSGLHAAYWAGGAPPDVVIAPLMDTAFDIIDVAERLARLGFRGCLQAVSEPLPDREAVMREIAKTCRSFRFELIEISEADLPARDASPGP
jgi:hypothetical protein